MSAQIVPKINGISSKEKIKINPAQQNPQIMEQPKAHSALPLSEDPRTLQLALELSLVGLNDNQSCFAQPSRSVSLPLTTQSDFDVNSINVVSAYPKSDSLSLSSAPNGLLLSNISAQICLEERSKKSQNMTECVPVPSSEHVAEIVGRQGCKIKALRAKTNTYIKTPVRGEEPVFVVTGRKEDVNKAKREILSAADHFSLIRASRKPLGDGQNSGSIGNVSSSCINGNPVSRMQTGPPCVPGQITIQVRVPYRVVGLVVGPKGATIKHIQQETQTYIVTPSREKEPIFEVTGLPDNVDTARKQIEAHIALRTGVGSGNGAAGVLHGSESFESHEYGALPTINSLTQILNDDINSEILSSIYKSGLSSVDYSENSMTTFGNGIDDLKVDKVKPMQCHHVSTCYKKKKFAEMEIMPAIMTPVSSEKHVLNNEVPLAKPNVYRNATCKSLSFCPPACTSVSIHSNSGANIITRSCSSASSTTSTKSTNNRPNTPPEILNIWKNLNDSIDVDEGIGDSPSIWNQSTNILPTSHCSPTASISPTDSLLGLGEHSASKQKGEHILKEPPLCNSQQKIHSAPLPLCAEKSPIHRECSVCNDNEVTTALVPCGHNMFCMECANQICISLDAVCPVCNSIVYHAMRILG
ncbi:hypothetical protein KR018_000417 [Drosophila ironensis]|nr:hypothetical protein KR018_000417 [Drosophila ironensis]